MVRLKAILILFSALCIGLVLAVLASGKVSWRQRRRYHEGLICHVERTLMSLDDGDHEDSLECDILSSTQDEMLPDMSIAIDLPDELIHENKNQLDAGALYVHIPGGFVNEEYIEGFGSVGSSVHIPPGSDISVLDETEVKYMHRRRRRTSQNTRGLEATGVRSVMVFRVTTDDASPEIGATEIGERMWSPTSFSFASQFDKCSFGQLTFEPYDVQAPVTELYVPGETSSFTERTILNAATRRVADTFGKDIWDRIDHAIFCMPDGTSGKPYIAYSGVGSFFSVYHNLRCAYPTTVMHELSHNLGLGHAFENGEEYGDETTIMGFSSSSKTGPSKCFNGQNIWHFGWFKSRSVMVDPFQGHQVIELAPFVDFDRTSEYQAVLITIFDMHIVYNRAKSFNAETSEYRNKVTIVKEENEINSALLAVLDMDRPVYTVDNILGSGRALHVQLCEAVVGVWEADFYTLSIGLDYAVCPQPTQTPSRQPTPLPTGWPTPGPTTRWPTPSPTPWPTPLPTPWPTQSPTPWPTPMPTTSSPTFEPTEFPSSVPTSLLPEIILVPLDPPADVTDDLVVFPFEETQMPKKPEDGSDRPMITVSGSVPTLVPLDLGNNNATGAVSIQDINDSLKNGPATVATILIACVVTAFVSCCACACIRWNQRRMDEQKRNLRLLRYNASSQVKIYMQDPV